MSDEKIQVYKDHVAEKLDEMADLCEYWKRNRDKGRTPGAIRAALLMLVEEVRAVEAHTRTANVAANP